MAMNKIIGYVIAFLSAGVFSILIIALFNLLDHYILKQSLVSTSGNLFVGGFAFGYAFRDFKTARKMKISLIHPSRGRAEKSFQTVKKWIQSVGLKCCVTFSACLYCRVR